LRNFSPPTVEEVGKGRGISDGWWCDRVVRWWGHYFSSGWKAGGAEGGDLLMKKEEGR
jgi:hypothetical protein